MKTMSLLIAAFSLSALAACQSAPVNSAPRSFELGGAQSRVNVEIPANDAGSAINTAQPYALEGTSNTAAAVAPGAGYQAR